MQHTESAALWIDAVEIEVRDGIAFAHVHSGGRDLEFRASMATFASAMESMARAYSGHLCREQPIVTRIGSARRRH